MIDNKCCKYFPINQVALQVLLKQEPQIGLSLSFHPFPKPRKVFEFIEEIPDSFGFEIYGIKRISTGVYNVSFNDSVL